jgi:hypothetical protein
VLTASTALSVNADQDSTTCKNLSNLSLEIVIYRSPDPELQPGRVCKQLVNECARRELNTCSPFAGTE